MTDKLEKLLEMTKQEDSFKDKFMKNREQQFLRKSDTFDAKAA